MKTLCSAESVLVAVSGATDVGICENDGLGLTSEFDVVKPMELPHNVAQRRLSIAALLVEVILAILIVIE
jgi:hypothetical protein